MKIVTLHGTEMPNRSLAHGQIRHTLGFGDYYGENLDALWDMLTTEGEELEIIIEDSDSIRQQLGEYGDALLKCFMDAAEENPQISVELL